MNLGVARRRATLDRRFRSTLVARDAGGSLILRADFSRAAVRVFEKFLALAPVVEVPTSQGSHQLIRDQSLVGRFILLGGAIIHTPVDLVRV
jgi:hypothetical protein